MSERPKCNILVETLLNPRQAITLTIHKYLKKGKACYLSLYWSRRVYIPSVQCLVLLAVLSGLSKTAQTAGFYNILDTAATPLVIIGKLFVWTYNLFSKWQNHKVGKRRAGGNLQQRASIVVTGCNLYIWNLKYSVGLSVGMGPQGSVSNFRVPCISAKLATATRHEVLSR